MKPGSQVLILKPLLIIGTAAQRIPWRADLYELAGHAYYHAKEYGQASDAYQKAFSRHVLSPEGWVAWGDVNYLNDDPERATANLGTGARTARSIGPALLAAGGDLSVER